MDMDGMDGPAAAGPSVAAAAAAAADAAATSLGASLGLSDLSLEEGKTAASEPVKSNKRPKVSHGLFFDDDRGLKKVLKTFPSIQFKGKGREYEDVSLLLAHYKKWFAELYPYGEQFEDLVLKSRNVLELPDKDPDDGSISDARERLHAFRFQYKNSAPDVAPTAAGSTKMSDEMRAKIEANRQKALEKKRQREGGDAGPAPAAAAPAPTQEVDYDEIARMEQEFDGLQGASQGAPFGGFDDEEDPFFGGGGFDDPFGGGCDEPFAGGSVSAPSAGGSQTAAKAGVASSFDDDEDVFGHGHGFDEPEKPPASAPQAAPPAAKPALDPEVARRIAENKAKALARKKALAAPAEPSAGAAVTEAAPAEVAAAATTQIEASAAENLTQKAAASSFDEEDGFDFGGGGFDDCDM